ncbi:MAG: hypothetical protein NC191_00525 [Muribaculaceae bacterium]|nr:hypothetical protein [Muribaculaceae bacterium]
MKNKISQIIVSTTLAVLFCTADVAFAAPTLPAELKTMITKFSLAMGGVVVFSIIISVGLSLYNKFFVANQIKDFKLSKDSLKTPSDTDEAIMSFITKNKG